MEKKNQDVKPKSLQNFKPQLNLHQDPCPSTPQSSPICPRSEEWSAHSVFAPFKPNFRVQIVMWQFLCDCAAAQ